MLNRIGLAIVTALITANVAWAGSQLESTRSACGVLNCAGTTFRGIYQATEPFVVQVFAREGECLRLDIDEQTEDMAMVVMSPSVWDAFISDDRDFDGGDTRPLIGWDLIPWTGWYTVIVSYFDHDPRLVGRFNLNYGRYPGGNVNCQMPAAATAQQLRLLGGDVSRSVKQVAGATENVHQDE